MQISLRDLALVCAKTFRTVKTRVSHLPSESGEHGAMLYELGPAIQAIFKPDSEKQTKDMAHYRLLREKSEAKLAQVKAEKIKIEVRRMKGKLMDVSEAQDSVAHMIVSFRAKTLALPSKCAARVAGLEDAREVESILKECVYEALHELSQIQLGEAHPSSVAHCPTS
jgi:hypothetical protein